MKKLVTLLLIAGCTLGPAAGNRAEAVPIAEIIRQGVIKVIRAVDLQIQRLQNRTIWLQNAQKVLENKLAQLRLTEISEWTQKQRNLYDEYYQELWKVKNAIATYSRMREIMQMQVALVDEYKRAYGLFRRDKHFTAEELRYMQRVYTGILEESVKSLDQILLVVNAFSTQMSDAQRLQIINAAADAIEKNARDLRQFNAQNIRLSLARAGDQRELERVQQLYGLSILP